MGQNSDINNIFNSYRNNVLLNEAVMDTEVDSPPRQLTPEQQAAVQKIMSEKGYNKARAELMVLKGQEVIDQKNAMQSQGIKSGSTVYTTPKGSTSPISTQPVADNNAPTQATPQQPAPQPTPQQPAQPEADDESGYEEVETTTQNVTNTQSQTQPLVTSDDGTSYTADDIKKMINDLKMEPVASADNDQNDEEKEDEDSGWEEVGTPEKENVTSQAKTISTVAEKYNIAKFLKCLSEKNYSLANKYLSNIIKNKVKSKISGEIK
jgi:hypothetical protein